MNISLTYKEKHFTQQSWSVEQVYSFDAWGNRRNPDDWTMANIPTEFLFDRGFTGHCLSRTCFGKHLDAFDLINMNGRVYDPKVGRFLSPDNYVQAPSFSQSFNRYSYCFNNPLVYTDPSGELLGTLFTTIWDLGATIFTKGGIDPWNTPENRQEAWRDFDPTGSWSKTNKAWRIDKGLLITDPNKTTGGRMLELLSRFTWQLPQTVIGNVYSHTTNVFYNRVNSVEYYGGATILDVDNLIWDFDQAIGVTLGNYIAGEGISSNPFEIDPNTGRLSRGAWLLRHEYGHYIQSQRNGPLFLPKYGIPSAAGALWSEIDAEFRSDQYFIRHYGTDPFINGPRGGAGNLIDPTTMLFNSSPAGYRPVNAKWWEYGTFFIGGPFYGIIIISALNINRGR